MICLDAFRLAVGFVIGVGCGLALRDRPLVVQAVVAVALMVAFNLCMWAVKA